MRDKEPRLDRASLFLFLLARIKYWWNSDLLGLSNPSVYAISQRRAPQTGPDHPRG